MLPPFGLTVRLSNRTVVFCLLRKCNQQLAMPVASPENQTSLLLFIGIRGRLWLRFKAGDTVLGLVEQTL
jgi:hypothetical protein